MKEKLNLTGKCVFCEYHELAGQHYFGCTKPDNTLTVRRTTPLGGDYPVKFSPSCLDGECSNWELKRY